ncbi:hypothetical protein JKG47_09200 [Acidithiobacillus sp. MC6.1]|nr:hypothetical protein [Acidithiobacillus sp. MC6.1]
METMTTLDFRALETEWQHIGRQVPLRPIRSESDYDKAIEILDRLLDHIGENEDHPLMTLVDLLTDRVRRYEEQQFPMGEVSPENMLRFLMEQHGLRQADLKDLAPESTISAVLSGKRSISKKLAIRLGGRFHISPAVFL